MEILALLTSLFGILKVLGEAAKSWLIYGMGRKAAERDNLEIMAEIQRKQLEAEQTRAKSKEDLINKLRDGGL